MLRSYVETDQTARISLQISINVKEPRQQKQPVRQSLGDPANPSISRNQPRRRRSSRPNQLRRFGEGLSRAYKINAQPQFQKNVTEPRSYATTI
jgi:hypothetical protein